MNNLSTSIRSLVSLPLETLSALDFHEAVLPCLSRAFSGWTCFVSFANASSSSWFSECQLLEACSWFLSSLSALPPWVFSFVLGLHNHLNANDYPHFIANQTSLLNSRAFVMFSLTSPIDTAALTYLQTGLLRFPSNLLHFPVFLKSVSSLTIVSSLLCFKPNPGYNRTSKI